MKDNLLYSFLLLTCVGISGNIQAQMGIGTNTPHRSAILDLTDGHHGLLIPRMTDLSRQSISKPAQGLMVYDTTYKMIFYFIGTKTDTSTTNWIGLSPWRFRDIERTTDRHAVLDAQVANVGIGVTDPKSKFTVMKEVSIGSNTKAPTNGLYVKGKISTDDTIKTSLAFAGHGTIPLGGIIMWSGDTASIPEGWALCNGDRSTPNLSGRFIVGFDSKTKVSPPIAIDTVENYAKVGNIGGKKTVKLDSTQMPSHSHTITDTGHVHDYTDRYPNNSNSFSTFHGSTDGWYADVLYPIVKTVNSKTGIRINNAGGDQPHENRPPYYVLAYIMRVK